VQNSTMTAAGLDALPFSPPLLILGGRFIRTHPFPHLAPSCLISHSFSVRILCLGPFVNYDSVVVARPS